MAGKNNKNSAENLSLKVKKTNGLKDSDLDYFRILLLEKRREIIGSVNDMESGTLKQSQIDASGDLSSMPIHMADRGTDTFEQEFSLGLVDGEKKILKEIDEALARIQDGTFGICQGNGKAIPIARLKAKPWARYCVEYARKMENGEPPKH
ncbi:MAG: TraR/DksA C4-type zinc finger protein [Phycisphaerae bacterium]